MHLQTADWAFLISLFSLGVTAIASVLRASESKSTRRISIFTSTVDKYVGQIADSLLTAERAIDFLPRPSDPSAAARRSELFELVNQSRRTTGRFLNVIIASRAFDTGGWKDFDEPFDMIMLRAVVVRASTDEGEIKDALLAMSEALSSLRARAYLLRDEMMIALLDA